MPESEASELPAALARIASYESGLRTTWLTRAARKLGPTRWFSELYRRVGPRLDPWLLRRTSGLSATKLFGLPTLLLVTTGSKSGQRRTSPLLYTRDGDAFVVVGTNFGTERHPAWTANLQKHPEAEIVVGTDTLVVRAELLGSDEFARQWPKFRAVYGGYDAYLERLTQRTPRMFALHPIALRR